VTEALEWAKQYCPAYITVDLHQDGYNTYNPNLYDFFFERSEQGQKQMLMFQLKWA
jgi:hypothetical protein